MPKSMHFECCLLWLAVCAKKKRGEVAFLLLRAFVKLGWQTRLERATPGTTIQCSNQLSYCHHFWKSNIENFIGLFVKALLEIFIFLFQIFRKVLVSSGLSCVLQGAEAGITHLQIWIWKIFNVPQTRIA